MLQANANRTNPSQERGIRSAALYRVLTLSTLCLITLSSVSCLAAKTKIKTNKETTVDTDTNSTIGDTTQSGLLNIAIPSSGSAAGWILSAILAGVVVVKHRQLRRVRLGVKHCFSAIELLSVDGEHADAMRELKSRIAKAEARKFGPVEGANGRRCSR